MLIPTVDVYPFCSSNDVSDAQQDETQDGGAEGDLQSHYKMNWSLKPLRSHKILKILGMCDQILVTHHKETNGGIITIEVEERRSQIVVVEKSNIVIDHISHVHENLFLTQPKNIPKAIFGVFAGSRFCGHFPK